MNYRILGKTGLRPSVIGFGGIPIQKLNIEEIKEIFFEAQEQGINFLDSARTYTISEEAIGEAIKGHRNKWIIATKSRARDFSSMEKDIVISLSNFKTEYIDLYQLHNVRTEADYEKTMSENGAYKALMSSKEKGQIGHIGITTHSLDMLRIFIESGNFETIMYPYNIVETEALDLFKRAKELNIGVIAMKPMAGGALTKATVAMKFILENQDISVVIPGMASIKEVKENAIVGNKFISLTLKEREEALEDAKKLGDKICRGCGYCAPCPVEIDIPGCFLFKGYKDRYDLSLWAENNYFSQETRGKDCVQCGACEKRCPYGLPIRNMLKEVRKTFNE
ncbi:MAG TPA: aldo/keto reductase [Clostridiaceae bacterium]